MELLGIAAYTNFDDSKVVAKGKEWPEQNHLSGIRLADSIDQQGTRHSIRVRMDSPKADWDIFDGDHATRRGNLVLADEDLSGKFSQ